MSDRRKRGTGSIRPLDGGRWELRVSHGRDPGTGKYRQQSKVVKGSERVARATLRDMVAEVDQQRQRATRGLMAFVLDEYVHYLEDQRKSAGTLRATRSQIDNHLIPAIGHIAVAELDPHDLTLLYRRMLDKGLEPSSVRRAHGVVSAALTMAQRRGWLGRQANPARLAEPPMLVSKDPVPPSAEEVQTLLKEAERRNPTMATLMFVAATTGARRGELCALRWSHVDFDRGLLTFAGSIWYVGRGGEGVGWGLKSTKTGKPRRVALDEATVEALARHRVRQFADPEVLVADPYVFAATLEGDQPYMPDSVTQFFGNLRDDLGLRHVHLHSLRHFMATQLLGAGVDVRTVSGRGGWANANVLLGTYAHFMPEQDRAASAVMGALVAPPDEP